MPERSASDGDDPVIRAIEALAPLREVIAAHGLSASKKLGQNFLLDLNLTRKIARAAGPLDAGTIIEVGPGPGGLTRALLLEGARTVVAIEKDRRCIDALAPLVEAAAGRLTLIEGDALEIDIEALGAAPRRIAANLPYNVATPLLVGWLGKAEKLASLTCMFQREVADRITARPGEKPYSRLGVLANWRCHTSLEFGLPPRAFTPPPKVASAVVRLDPITPPPSDCAMTDLEAVTAAAFGQRRKMLRQSLKSLAAAKGTTAEVLLESAGIEPTNRAEQIDIDSFARLAGLIGSDHRDDR